MFPHLPIDFNAQRSRPCTVSCDVVLVCCVCYFPVIAVLAALRRLFCAVDGPDAAAAAAGYVPAEPAPAPEAIFLTVWAVWAAEAEAEAEVKELAEAEAEAEAMAMARAWACRVVLCGVVGGVRWGGL